MSSHELEIENETKTTLGFWVYLMTDCMLFASLFATYAVLRNNTANGPSAGEIFQLRSVLVETLILLTSSFICGMALLAAKAKNKRFVIIGLGLTFVLGLAFVLIEFTEFRSLVKEGHSWTTSGFLSGFFTLVGTHGLHILSGLIWLFVLGLQIAKKGLTPGNTKKLALFSLFWHFLDIIWIFIFTFVYLMGGIRI